MGRQSPHRNRAAGLSSRPRRSAVIIAAVLASGGPARAQDDPHAACAVAPVYVPAELLERPVPLRTGVGNSREGVTTSSSEAQAFYNQGLNYLESYVWIEASRSFHQALRLDPKLAMADIGLSRVYLGVHYLSDVVAGFAAGLSWLAVCLSGTEAWVRWRDWRRKRAAAARGARERAS